MMRAIKWYVTHDILTSFTFLLVIIHFIHRMCICIVRMYSLMVQRILSRSPFYIQTFPVITTSICTSNHLPISISLIIYSISRLFVNLTFFYFLQYDQNCCFKNELYVIDNILTNVKKQERYINITNIYYSFKNEIYYLFIIIIFISSLFIII